jgi:hypothetical protein
VTFRLGTGKVIRFFYSVVAFVSKARVCKRGQAYMHLCERSRSETGRFIVQCTDSYMLSPSHIHLSLARIRKSNRKLGHTTFPARCQASIYISLLGFPFFISFDRTAGTHSWPLSIGQHTKWMHLKWTSFFLLFDLVLALPWTGVGLELAWCWPGVGLVLAWC